ncbi:MAG: hypothetical protein V1843_01855 [bacterium]
MRSYFLILILLLIPISVSAAPTFSFVHDGLSATSDINYQSSITTLSCTWAATDSGSNIAEYKYKITEGSISGATVEGWTSTGLDNYVTKAGLSLTNGYTYYFSISASNEVGEATIFNSDGVIINSADTEAPQVLSISPGISGYINASDPRITASFYDPLGVDPNSIRLQFDGVTAEASTITATNTNMTYVKGASLEGNTVHTATLVIKDYVGNAINPLIWSFTADAVSPEVQVLIDGGGSISGDTISDTPAIQVILTDSASVDAGSIKILVDGTQVSYTISGLSKNRVVATYQVPSSGLSAMMAKSLVPSTTHTITVEASDSAGYAVTVGIGNLRVLADSDTISVNPLNYPNPFRPSSREGTYISYTLPRSMEIQVYVYDMVGNLVWKRTYDEATMGGRAGYNEIYWSGESDFGEIVGNGAYMVRVVNAGRTLGKCRMIVMD